MPLSTADLATPKDSKHTIPISTDTFVMGILGCFPFNQNFKKMGNSGKQYRNFPEKFPEIPEIVEFPKYQPFNRKL